MVSARCRCGRTQPPRLPPHNPIAPPPLGDGQPPSLLRARRACLSAHRPATRHPQHGFLSEAVVQVERWIERRAAPNQKEPPVSARLCIDAVESKLAANPKSRWIIFVSQGNWSNPILSYRADPGSQFGLAEFIAHCSERGHDEMLERVHAKARRGRPVWFNDVPIEAAEVMRLLDLHDREDG